MGILTNYVTEKLQDVSKQQETDIFGFNVWHNGESYIIESPDGENTMYDSDKPLGVFRHIYSLIAEELE